MSGYGNRECDLLVLIHQSTRTKDLEEKKYGLAAKEFLTKWVTSGGVTLKTFKVKRGKFGRILGELWCFNTNVNEKMIEEHHAVRYHGQSKQEIAEEHLANREILKLHLVESFE